MRVRTKKKGRAFVTVPADLIQSTALSAEARFMYVLLWSYPDDWEFRRAHLQEVTGFGREKVTRVIGELRDIGLVQTVTTRGEGGRVTGSTWYVYDTTEVERARADAAGTSHHREPENPSPGQPSAGNPDPLTKKKVNQEETESPQPPTTSPAEPVDRVPVILAHLRRIWPPDKVRAVKRAENALRGAIAAGAEPASIVPAARAYLDAEKARESGRFIRPLFAWINDADLAPTPPSASRPADVDGLARMFGERIGEGKFVSPSAFSATVGRRIVELGLADAARLKSLGLPS